MNIHEYQAKQLFERFGVATPKGIAAANLAEAANYISTRLSGLTMGQAIARLQEEWAAGKAALDTFRDSMKHRKINITLCRPERFALIVVFADEKIAPPPLLALLFERSALIGGDPWHPKKTANSGNIEHRPGKPVESLTINLLDAGKQALQHAQGIQRLLETMHYIGRQNLGALAKALHQQGLLCTVGKTISQQRQRQAKRRCCQHDGVTKP